VRVSGVLFITVVIILIISGICIWFFPSIQDYIASNTMWNGIRSFSDEFNAENIYSLDDLQDLAEQKVLIAIPYLDYSDEALLKIKQFIDAGGTLLLMDDYGYGNNILEYLGLTVRFTSKPLLDPLFNYKNQNIPRITDFVREVKEIGIDVIIFNHATTLSNVLESEVIAWSSSASYLDTNENGILDHGEPEGPFVIAAEFLLDKGVLTLVSDPSIIINTMVGRDDNYDFIRYLIRHIGKQKSILVDNSHISKAPLDISKWRLINMRMVLTNPYSLIGITAMIFIVVSRYTLKKGDVIGE